MKEHLTAACYGLIAGLAAGLAAIDLEWLSFYISLIASVIVIVASISIYVTREWPLKLAITPLFLSSIIFISYSFSIAPTAEIGAICQMADAVGIMALLAYVIWNRRKRNARKETKETARKEKAPTSAEMKLVK